MERQEYRLALMQTQKLLKEKLTNKEEKEKDKIRIEEEIKRVQEELQNKTKNQKNENQWKPMTSSDVKLLTQSLDKMVQSLCSKDSKVTFSKLPDFDGSYKCWPKIKQAYEESSRACMFSHLEKNE